MQQKERLCNLSFVILFWYLGIPNCHSERGCISLLSFWVQSKNLMFFLLKRTKNPGSCDSPRSPATAFQVMLKNLLMTQKKLCLNFDCITFRSTWHTLWNNAKHWQGTVAFLDESRDAIPFYIGCQRRCLFYCLLYQ